MELKDLINFGYKYYLDENDNFKEIINENDRNRTINENFNNENLQKKWFFSFFNNYQQIHDNNYNKKIDDDDDSDNDSDIEEEDSITKQKIKLILKNKILNPIYIEENLDENYILKLIKEKSKHFFPKEIYFNNDWNDDFLEIESELKFLIPKFEELEDIIINNKDEKFLEYFENDENFNFYLTYQDLYNIDFYYKSLCKNKYNYLFEKYQDLYDEDSFCKTFISNILNKLRFKTYNKVIYLNEYNYKEKLEENPFKILKKHPNLKRVITYYNTINFILYEPVEFWSNRQKINSNFKNQKKLQNYLSKIIFYENTMNMFFRHKDLKKKELMLSLFMKNKFDIDYESFTFENGDFKETYNIINDYIYCEINKEELNFIDKNLMKSLNDLRSQILPKIINDKNNNDLYLLNFYLNNPKNNEDIIISLLNKYKNIL